MKHGRWSILLLLSLAELLGMSLWFSASAVSPHFQQLWSLSPEQAGWLTTIVQLGFVTGTALAATFNVADVIPSRYLFAVSGLLAAAANAALVVAPDFAIALTLRFLTGMLLAGVYPPAMKMIATWFVSSRGFAIGTIVGALTLGKATPYLLGALPSLNYRSFVLFASLGAGIGALMVFVGYRDGPAPFARRPFSWKLAGDVLRDRPTRLAIGGYLHMWELYAMLDADFAVLRGLFHGTWIGVAPGARVCGRDGVCRDRRGRSRVSDRRPVGGRVGARARDDLGDGCERLVCAADRSRDGLVTRSRSGPRIGLQAAFGWSIAFAMLVLGPTLGIIAMLRLQRARAQPKEVADQ